MENTFEIKVYHIELIRLHAVFIIPKNIGTFPNKRITLVKQTFLNHFFFVLFQFDQYQKNYEQIFSTTFLTNMLNFSSISRLCHSQVNPSLR